MHSIDIAEPYINSLEHIGHNLMLRKREAEKEKSPTIFNNHIRTESKEEAFFANTGSIRQYRHENMRKMLRKY